MTTRHIVRINPLHCSILFTTVSSGFDLKQAFAGLTAETVWSAVAINLVLVFVGSFLLTQIYNFLAKYLGGIEITLDDD